MSKEIRISQVLQDLEEGVTRIDMITKYGITQREVKALFKHPKLKNKKVKKVFVPSFELVDDVPDEGGVEGLEVASPSPVANETESSVDFQ